MNEEQVPLPQSELDVDEEQAPLPQPKLDLDEEQELAPLPQHELDMVPPELAELFRDLIKYRVDPAGDYYGLSLETLTEKIQSLDTQTVHAIDSEYRYERKGHMYDPILQSFVQGCGGQITTWAKSQSSEVPAVLRGITKRKEMNTCREAGRDFYYIDTGYFGNGKKKLYHRITRNDVQNIGPVISRPRDRLAATGWQPKKFTRGSKILLAPPSQKLLNLYDIDLDTWLESVQAEIRANTDREVVVRRKQGRSIRVNQDTMEMALSDDIHCLITFSSIAATEALLFGKPAITLGPNAAQSLCSRSVSAIENLNIPTMDEVEEWAAHLAYCQFTEYDMRNGTAWRILNDH
jgi:hypothetical protein